MNHTPGPWTFIQQDGDDMGGFKDANGEWVCWFGDDYPYYPEQGTPPEPWDASLIAAAPDLLFALVNLLAVKRGEGGTKFNCNVIAEEAIAKATGISK